MYGRGILCFWIYQESQPCGCVHVRDYITYVLLYIIYYIWFLLVLHYYYYYYINTCTQLSSIYWRNTSHSFSRNPINIRRGNNNLQHSSSSDITCGQSVCCLRCTRVMPRDVGTSAARDGGDSNARTRRCMSSLPLGAGVCRVCGLGVGFSINIYSMIYSDILYVYR